MKKTLFLLSIMPLISNFGTTSCIKLNNTIFKFISKNKAPKNIAFDYIKSGYWIGLINLIEKDKIDLNLKDDNNKTILDIAKEEKNIALINLINNKLSKNNFENKNANYEKQEKKSEI